MKLSVAILAGGKSTRMGTNKALLTINNDTFLNAIAKEMHFFDEVLVCVDDKKKYADMPYTMIEDVHKEIGPIEGIYQALLNAENEYVFVCATDMPYLKKELVSYIREFVSGDYDCFVLKDGEKVHPLCAIYSKRMLPVIAELIENKKYKLINMFNMVRTKYIDINLTCYDKKCVKNINTKEDYESINEPLVFCVSAVKDSGKTGLIVKLINEFIKDNMRVGVIKHDGHDFVMDIEGTDTFKCAQAGALATAIYSDTKCAVIKYVKKDIDYMIRCMDDVDVIIIEGLKGSTYPKVEVVRKEVSDTIVCDKTTLICVATDAVLIDAVECPVFDINDIDGIYSCIKNYYKK